MPESFRLSLSIPVLRNCRARPERRTTTPVIKKKTVDTKNGFAFPLNDMGFVRDASVKTVEGCDQYSPSRPMPPRP